MKRNTFFSSLLLLIAGLLLSVDAFAQQMVVKGLIKDTTGEPIIGANVVVKGSTNNHRLGRQLPVTSQQR